MGRRRGALGLAVLVALLVHAAISCRASAGAVHTAVELGLLPACAIDLAPDMPVTRSLWGIMLYDTLAAWLPPGPSGSQCRDLPRDGDGDVLAALVGAGWIDLAGTRSFLPFRPVTRDQALLSLAAAFRAAGQRTAAPTATRSGTPAVPRELALLLAMDAPADGSRPLGLTQAAALLSKAVQLLQPPVDAPTPASAVQRYLSNLGQALESGSMCPPLLPVCGSAAANLARNSGRLATGRYSLQLSALDVIRVDRAGLLAVVTARRRMIVSTGGAAQESDITDVFRLRLTPAGWSIYR
ncbi:MAG: hypothetical protein Q8P31_04410 [Bacillota bacterium]|nr:hypothetical protein [Bacillota bacterium]